MMMNIVKYLQAQGVGSKKTCLALIKQSQISINQCIIDSAQVDIIPGTVKKITVKGKCIEIIPMPYFYIELNKPAHYEVSHKPRNYPSVFSLLPVQLRNLDIQAIGRLDADTTGLLLFTNDGQFNHYLTSPKNKIEKEYWICLKHSFTPTQEELLLSGVLLKDGNEVIQAKNIQIIDVKHIMMTITCGKYHQIKRMIAAVGNRVEFLKRTRLGELKLSHQLKEGAWHFIHPDMIISDYSILST